MLYRANSLSVLSKKTRKCVCFRNFVVAVRLFVTMEKALMNVFDIKNVPSLLLAESCSLAADLKRFAYKQIL